MRQRNERGGSIAFDHPPLQAHPSLATIFSGKNRQIKSGTFIILAVDPEDSEGQSTISAFRTVPKMNIPSVYFFGQQAASNIPGQLDSAVRQCARPPLDDSAFLRDLRASSAAGGEELLRLNEPNTIFRPVVPALKEFLAKNPHFCLNQIKPISCEFINHYSAAPYIRRRGIFRVRR